MAEKDVLTIGSKQVNSTEQEKKEKIQEMARQMAEDVVRKTFRTPFQQVLNEINKGKTLKEVISDVEQKKSKLSKAAREFVVNFQENRIQEWIDTNDEFEKRLKEAKMRLLLGKR